MALGYPHPDHLLRVLTSKQVSEWMAYNQLEPFGYRVDWLRFGVLAATIANSAPRKKGSKPFTPEDFMPNPKRGLKRPRKQSAEDMKEIMMGLAGKGIKRPGASSRG